MTSNVLKFPGKKDVSDINVVEIKKSAAPDLQALMLQKMQEAMAEAIPHFPLGTPKETVLNAMENAKEGERFSMDVLIENNLDPEARAKADAERIAKKLENKNRW